MLDHNSSYMSMGEPSPPQAPVRENFPARDWGTDDGGEVEEC